MNRRTRLVPGDLGSSSGIVPAANGGTGAANTPTSGTVLRGNGTAFVTSTFTLPDTYVMGDLLTATAANTLGAITGVAVGRVLQGGGVGAVPIYSIATYPTIATSAGTVLRADGTNWVASQTTYPDIVAATRVLYGTASNTVGSTASLTFDGDTLTITPTSTTAVAQVINAVASTSVVTSQWKYNSTDAAYLQTAAGATDFTLQSRDFGNNVAGPQMRILRNTNAGTEGPTAGTLRYLIADNTLTYSLWVDVTGDYRIHTAAPTGSTGSPTVSDTAGVVVGDQTSYEPLKKNITPITPKDRKDALEKVLKTPLYNFEIKKDPRSTPHKGYVIKDADRGSWFSQNDQGKDSTPALNQRNLFGHLALSIQEIDRRLRLLEKA